MTSLPSIPSTESNLIALEQACKHPGIYEVTVFVTRDFIDDGTDNFNKYVEKTRKIQGHEMETKYESKNEEHYWRQDKYTYNIPVIKNVQLTLENFLYTEMSRAHRWYRMPGSLQGEPHSEFRPRWLEDIDPDKHSLKRLTISRNMKEMMESVMRTDFTTGQTIRLGGDQPISVDKEMADTADRIVYPWRWPYMVIDPAHYLARPENKGRIINIR